MGGDINRQPNSTVAPTNSALTYANDPYQDFNFDNSAFDYGYDNYGGEAGNWGFDPMGNLIKDTQKLGTMDWAKMGIGGINSIAGLIGTFDTTKTNKVVRAGMEQNQRHAKMARDDRTAFLGGTKSSFA